MIPHTLEDLDAMAAEVPRQSQEVESLIRGLAPEARRWRPSPKRWSAVGHVAHLVIINRGYLGSIAAAVEDGNARGVTGDGPYKHSWLNRWFVGMLEPPPKRRLKTMKSMVPDPELEGDEVLGDFLSAQDELSRQIAAARGLDLGRVRFSSPFFSPLKFSLGAGLELLLAHNRRHIWLAREVMESPGFPAASRDSD